MAIPSVGRTERELTAPFAPKNRFAGLLVEDMEMFDAEDQYWTRFEKDRDADAFAKNWTAFVGASVFPTLTASLTTTDEDARHRFVERLESGLRKRLAANPTRVRIPLAKMLLDKRSWPR